VVLAVDEEIIPPTGIAEILRNAGNEVIVDEVVVLVVLEVFELFFAVLEFPPGTNGEVNIPFPEFPLVPELVFIERISLLIKNQ
jgi:hypothetical protein